MADDPWEMDELWRYAHDPDLLPAEVARWAYDRIRVLEGATGAAGRETPTETPLSGRWRTGHSVRPRVTLYRDDQIVGMALSGALAAEIVERCNGADTQLADAVERVIARFVEVGPLRDAARAFARAYIDGDDEAAAGAAGIRAMTGDDREPPGPLGRILFGEEDNSGDVG